MRDFIKKGTTLYGFECHSDPDEYLSDSSTIIKVETLRDIDMMKDTQGYGRETFMFDDNEEEWVPEEVLNGYHYIWGTSFHHVRDDLIAASQEAMDYIHDHLAKLRSLRASDIPLQKVTG